jgi:hypothetical protein
MEQYGGRGRFPWQLAAGWRTREALMVWRSEHGAFTEEEMARARREDPE